MQGIFQKENTDKALKYGIYRHLPTYEKIIRNLVSFYIKNNNIYSLNEKLGNWRIYRFKLDRNYSVAIVMGEHLQKGD